MPQSVALNIFLTEGGNVETPTLLFLSADGAEQPPHPKGMRWDYSPRFTLIRATSSLAASG